ncbi:MAG TPA: hypothetical protein VK559_11390, partial [Ferruginibacter sp.]|nr:hypothetical protein [Ferruginibacter sp.]
MFDVRRWMYDVKTNLNTSNIVHPTSYIISYLHTMRLFAALVLSLFFLHATAQKKSAFVSGRVVD